MKVVHVETGRHLYGGAQQVLYLSHGLRQKSVDTTIICTPDSAIDAAARLQNLAVHNLPCHGELDLPFAFRLSRALSAIAPDLVHCHSRRGADIYGGRVSRMLGIPALLSRRVDSTENALMARLRYAPYRYVVAISQTVNAALTESGVDSERLATIRSAVDTDALAGAPDRELWQRDFGVDDAHVVALVAAQLIERKGHHLLLRVLPELCRAHPEFRLLIFGSGPLESTLRDQAAQLGLQKQVEFCGFRGDLDRFLGCADLLIHPATKEGLGVAMLKAAAAGLPVAAFDVAGAREAVVHEQTGLLAVPGDGNSLLHAVTQLVENPALRQQFGQAGQQRMRAEFSVRHMVDEHLGLYESVLDG